GVYTQHVVQSAGNTYGTFAVVIGLLTWLYVGARVLVYSAEFNSVLTARLWPRSLLGPPQTEADLRAKAADLGLDS
ncbi:MAG: rane protein, partial [Solirubrobacteraceae bacterium]|nr:rane protein [Solirubrobacteraceae bacterium]